MIDPLLRTMMVKITTITMMVMIKTITTKIMTATVTATMTAIYQSPQKRNKDWPRLFIL